MCPLNSAPIQLGNEYQTSSAQRGVGLKSLALYFYLLVQIFVS